MHTATKKHSITRLSLALGLVLALAAYSSRPAAATMMSPRTRRAESDGGTTEVAIGTQPWIGYGPFWIADEQGFDTDHGVDIKLVNFSTDQDLESGFASGKFQAANNANNTLIRPRRPRARLQDRAHGGRLAGGRRGRLVQPRDPIDRGRRGREGRVRGVLGLRRALPLRDRRGGGRYRLDRVHPAPGCRCRHGGGRRPGRRRGHLRALPAGGGQGGRRLRDHLHRGREPGADLRRARDQQRVRRERSGGGRRSPAGVGRRGRLLQHEHRGRAGDHRRERRLEARGARVRRSRAWSCSTSSSRSGLPRDRLRDALERHPARSWSTRARSRPSPT